MEYRRLRAPRADRSIFVEPEWNRVGDMVARNLQLRASSAVRIAGMAIETFREHARSELLDAARRWTSTYADLPADEPTVNSASDADGVGAAAAKAAGKCAAQLPPAEHATQRVFLAGHQPQLIHSGVWLKNFALDRLAKCFHATAVNLIIDSDALKSASIRVPAGTPQHVRSESLPFDRRGGHWPFEQRGVLDDALFRSFGQRAAETMREVVPRPMIVDFWPMVVRRFEATGNLGAAIAQARHQWELGWGSRTLEVPQSMVCQTPSFLRFVTELLLRLPRFHRVYNAALAEYRRVHRVRSPLRPMPDLAATSEGLEAPLWLWTNNDPRRRRVFVRRRAGTLTLHDQAGVAVELPEDNLDAALEILEGLPARGIKLRTRALVTTLFARAVLGDLFLHGIGGAKYDQVTDQLIDGYLGLEPPGYLVVSATLHLPLAPRAAAADDLPRLKHELRELAFHPEQAIDWAAAAAAGQQEAVAAAIAEKRRWLETPRGPGTARPRHMAIRATNEALQPWVESARQRLRQLIDETHVALASEAARTYREYSFACYPSELLYDFFVRSLAPCPK